jgi:tRNA (cmo5U34)-methyltransferase
MNPDNASAHISSAYDYQVRASIPYYDSFHWETINLIKASKITPKTWLDCGCGTGTLAEKAIKAFPQTVFILLDPSEQMLAQAKRKLAAYSENRIRFLDSTTTNDAPNQLKKKVDVITAIQSHHYMREKDRIKATKTCFDLLNKGGIYVTFENIRPETKEGTQISLSNWKNYQMLSGKTGEEAEKHINRFDEEYHPITVNEHIQLLKKTGFPTAELLWHSYMQAGIYAIK